MPHFSCVTALQNLTHYSEDLEVEGIVRYSPEENLWVAPVDWNAVKESEDYAVQAKP